MRWLTAIVALVLFAPVAQAQEAKFGPLGPTATAPTGQLPGTATNDNACAGCIGEYIASNVPHASPVPLTTLQLTNITSISLTPGDWDIGGNIWFELSAFSGQTFQVGINTVSATMPDPSLYAALTLNTNILASVGMVAPTRRLSLAAPATVYLIGLAAFNSGTAGGSGLLWARRRR